MSYTLYDLTANYHRYSDDVKEWRMDVELKFTSVIELLETLSTLEDTPIRDNSEILLQMCLEFKDHKSGLEFINEISENEKRNKDVY